jgi:hypothetical protein
MPEYLWTKEASELLEMPSPKLLLNLRRRHRGTPAEIQGTENKRREIEDENGGSKFVNAVRFEREALIDWASKWYKTTSDKRTQDRMRNQEKAEGTMTLFPKGLRVTKQQGRNLVALGSQWRCTTEEALQRLLNIQGHALGRIGTALEDGSILSLPLNRNASEMLYRMEQTLKQPKHEIVFDLLCRPEHPNTRQFLAAMRFDNA